MKKIVLFIPIIIGCIFAAGLWLGSILNFETTQTGIFSSNVSKQKLNKLIDLIDKQYVDVVDTDSIVDIAVNTILQDLDPHSVYIPSESMERVSNNTKGEFVGIGVRYFVDHDTISVLDAIDDGPSDKAGIKGGDRIVTVNGKGIYGDSIVDSEQLGDLLRGNAGSKVLLGVKKPGYANLVDIAVVRGNVAIKSVEASFMLTDELGYIKVNRFAESTIAEFDKAIAELKSKGAKKIALDLRNNPGGILEAAVAMADEFLEKDKLILFQRDRNQKRSDTKATEKGSFEQAEVYILINESSASASEIVAGALQDNDIGTIVGRRSFGKGLVQQEVNFADGSAVRLTVSRYYTPTGRSIQRSYEDGTEAYYQEYTNRYNNGELSMEENTPVLDSLKFITPGGKVVYGGGGIIPDVFIPSSDDYMLRTINYYERINGADEFVNRYLQSAEGAKLQELSITNFYRDYQPPKDMLEEFATYYAHFNNGNKLLIAGYEKELRTLIKSSIADHLFTTELKNKILVQTDQAVQEVIRLSKNQE